MTASRRTCVVPLDRTERGVTAAEPDRCDHARRIAAASGTTVWLVVVAGGVTVLVPWLITGWQLDHEFPAAVRAVGAVVAGLGVVVGTDALLRFPLEGLGTPVPMAPTARLVVHGPYRRVRNPIYLAGLALVLGQALVFGSLALAVWAAALAAWFVGFVRFYEEPTLRQRYGEQYERYCQHVPRWLPSWRPCDDGRPD
jgi:protein-S-isoprenylcysteine O-methyltransferase Ste14